MNKPNNSPKKKTSLLSLLHLKKKKPSIAEGNAFKQTPYRLDGPYRNVSNPLDGSTNVSLCCAITETTKTPSDPHNGRDPNEPDVCSCAEPNASHHERSSSLGLRRPTANGVGGDGAENTPTAPSPLEKRDGLRRAFGRAQHVSADGIAAVPNANGGPDTAEPNPIRPSSATTTTTTTPTTSGYLKKSETKNNSMDSLARQALFAVQVLHLIPTSDVKER